jgi:hypothetical protein
MAPQSEDAHTQHANTLHDDTMVLHPQHAVGMKTSQRLKESMSQHLYSAQDLHKSCAQPREVGRLCKAPNTTIAKAALLLRMAATSLDALQPTF